MQRRSCASGRPAAPAEWCKRKRERGARGLRPPAQGAALELHAAADARRDRLHRRWRWRGRRGKGKGSQTGLKATEMLDLEAWKQIKRNVWGPSALAWNTTTPSGTKRYSELGSCQSLSGRLKRNPKHSDRREQPGQRPWGSIAVERERCCPFQCLGAPPTRFPESERSLMGFYALLQRFSRRDEQR